MNKAVEVKNLCFEYEDKIPVLKDISFSIEKGEYVTLIGHNGSGKSTLSKLIAYLLTPKSGEIFVDGFKVCEKNQQQLRKVLGIVFQNPDNQFIGSTVESDIAFGLENRNVPRDKMVELVHKYSSLVSMEKYLNKAPDELSGGQKQRVAIAGILALNLKIIILDEATAMLDPEGVEDIKNLIQQMRKDDKDLTFISITHDIEEAYLSDRVIILNDGQIFKDGKAEDVFLNTEEIKSIGLDIPFVIKIKEEMKKRGLNIPNNIRTLDELGDYICK